MVPNKWRTRLEEYSNVVEDEALSEKNVEDVGWLRDNLLGTEDELVTRANDILKRHYRHRLCELTENLEENVIELNKVEYMSEHITEEKTLSILRDEAEKFSEKVKIMSDVFYRALTGFEPPDY
ncbi:MAG: hypothetical protein ABEK36_05920 [Candidatus Aenigmatarchaeota archaeon]